MKANKYIWVAALGLLAAGFASCSDDDGNPYPDGDGAVVVDHIYLLDTKDDVKPERDITNDFARLGQTLRLSGSGFGGTKKVLINGYETYFNTTLVTDNSMIISVNGDTPVSDADPELRNKIQFVKNSGTYTKEFTIRASAPSITSIAPALPNAGDVVTVYGANLQECSSVVLPDGTEVTDITNATEDDEIGEWFSFVMPDGITEGGSITMTGANGSAKSRNYFNFKDAIILDFDGNGGHASWSWKETGSMCNGDDEATDPLGKYGKCCQIIPDRLMNPAEEKAYYNKSRVTEWWSLGDGDDQARNWAWMPFESTTTVDSLAFQFEVYVPEEWDLSGQIQITLNNNISYLGYGSDESKSSSTFTYVWTPWLNSDGTHTPYKTDGWTTVTIPLSQFSWSKYLLENENTVLTWGEIVAWRVAANYPNCGMGYVNTTIKLSDDEQYESIGNSTPLIYTDNWRIVPYESFTVSDFVD